MSDNHFWGAFLVVCLVAWFAVVMLALGLGRAAAYGDRIAEEHANG